MILPTTDALYREYCLRRQSEASGKVTFIGVPGCDVYNPTAPFREDEQHFIAARVEARDSENAQVRFFHWDGQGTARLAEDAPAFNLQDPFICRIDNGWLLGGVEITADPDGSGWQWRTQFWQGPSIFTLRLIAVGPWGMKDIRLLQLSDKRILVFTRPQGALGGRGKIGWLILNSLSELKPSCFEQGRLLLQLDDDSWCGVNEAHVIDEQWVGVLGHVASFDACGNRHYYAASFCLNVISGQATPLRIICSRDDLQPGESKRDDLRDVIFPGGLYRDGQRHLLFCGASDCEVHWREIADPF
ncbi:DUF1861 family protein [Scandinavium sp. H11S7]|uniref:DUF1861 family protein n=1 Tax=Scandinavium hiltneri TaxID=2926519 RepID=UPI0021652DE9|nr:DUF1861 family protein [Scandinavium hiltneri]MCS2156326.1 DUF1861 family protein [Scandinavium hiltneri]